MKIVNPPVGLISGDSRTKPIPIPLSSFSNQRRGSSSSRNSADSVSGDSRTNPIPIPSISSSGRRRNSSSSRNSPGSSLERNSSPLKYFGTPSSSRGSDLRRGSSHSGSLRSVRELVGSGDEESDGSSGDEFFFRQKTVKTTTRTVLHSNGDRETVNTTISKVRRVSSATTQSEYSSKRRKAMSGAHESAASIPSQIPRLRRSSLPSSEDLRIASLMSKLSFSKED